MLTEMVVKGNVHFSRFLLTVGTPSPGVFTASESQHKSDVNFPLMFLTQTTYM